MERKGRKGTRKGKELGKERKGTRKGKERN